jgi:hypothetical protein
MLIAVLTSLSFAVFNNKRYKDFIKGNDGMFATMKKGMSYSYRFGKSYTSETNFEEQTEFEYGTNKHDLYFNDKEGASRFFSSDQGYPDD